MNFVFRVDASAAMGTGHVMRCLAIAARLRSIGATVTFVSRRIEGDLIDYVRGDFKVKELPPAQTEFRESPRCAEAVARGARCDASETIRAMEPEAVDWLIVGSQD